VSLPLQVHEEKVAASATCASAACDRIDIKIVNFSSMQQRVAGAPACLHLNICHALTARLRANDGLSCRDL
jgi:hypothetical protein